MAGKPSIEAFNPPWKYSGDFDYAPWKVRFEPSDGSPAREFVKPTDEDPCVFVSERNHKIHIAIRDPSEVISPAAGCLCLQTHSLLQTVIHHGGSDAGI